jgi:hypothetical protein
VWIIKELSDVSAFVSDRCNIKLIIVSPSVICGFTENRTVFMPLWTWFWCTLKALLCSVICHCACGRIVQSALIYLTHTLFIVYALFEEACSISFWASISSNDGGLLTLEGCGSECSLIWDIVTAAWSNWGNPPENWVSRPAACLWPEICIRQQMVIVQYRVTHVRSPLQNIRTGSGVPFNGSSLGTKRPRPEIKPITFV